MPAYDISSPDHLERVYAGVLGKIIGVYLGRPFEGWSHEDIVAKRGEIDHYVHAQFNMPLVVTDDDIAGTFTFPRALADNGFTPHLTPAQIGEGWLNYLIDQRTVLWWGGMGVSTEHTAFLRLQSGIAAPESGSRARNGKTISEQIGAQIFIDGWAMLFPGDPEQAADWARRAGSVSHDGEAIHGAQIIAAIEAQAFMDRDINALIDTALQVIPADSIIARLIADVREWHAANDDWYVTRRLIGEHYGYDKYPGACHMVPNHALIILALLYGNGDFRRSQMIVNTAGWDTDCNAGNVGAILGIRDGLAAFENTPDYREPVADKLYLSTAEGGRGVSDAVRETYFLVNAARALAGESPLVPKEGARFHFSLPGSVQGFTASAPETATVGNQSGALHVRLNSSTATITTPTFTPEEASVFRNHGYRLFASPTLHPGQTVTANIAAPTTNSAPVKITLIVRAYGEDDSLVTHSDSAEMLSPGAGASLNWTVPALDNAPIQQVGLMIEGEAGCELTLDSLDWSGAPNTAFSKGTGAGVMWREAWIDGVDIWDQRWQPDFQLSHNRGIGLIAQGTEEWKDYTATATIRSPLAISTGIAVRIGGMRRFYALVLHESGTVQLVKHLNQVTILAELPFPWEADRDYVLSLTAKDNVLTGFVDSVRITATDPDRSLSGGSAGFVVEAGTIVSGPLAITPA